MANENQKVTPAGGERHAQDSGKWVRELKQAGWTKHATTSTIWVAPWGAWYRGPFKAWCVMKGVPCELPTSQL